jgi:hypothetical protein
VVFISQLELGSALEEKMAVGSGLSMGFKETRERSSQHALAERDLTIEISPWGSASMLTGWRPVAASSCCGVVGRGREGRCKGENSSGYARGRGR